MLSCPVFSRVGRPYHHGHPPQPTPPIHSVAGGVVVRNLRWCNPLHVPRQGEIGLSHAPWNHHCVVVLDQWVLFQLYDGRVCRSISKLVGHDGLLQCFGTSLRQSGHLRRRHRAADVLARVADSNALWFVVVLRVLDPAIVEVPVGTYFQLLVGRRCLVFLFEWTCVEFSTRPRTVWRPGPVWFGAGLDVWNVVEILDWFCDLSWVVDRRRCGVDVP